MTGAKHEAIESRRQAAAQPFLAKLLLLRCITVSGSWIRVVFENCKYSFYRVARGITESHYQQVYPYPGYCPGSRLVCPTQRRARRTVMSESGTHGVQNQIESDLYATLLWGTVMEYIVKRSNSYLIEQKSTG